MDWLGIVRKGGDVQRFHTTNMVKSQDVAQHSFNAAFIAEALATAAMNDGLDIDRHAVVMHMLLHDIPEQYIGDTPGWAKSGNTAVKQVLDAAEEEWCDRNLDHRHYYYMYGLDKLEMIICKFTDLAECGYKIVQDMRMGNREHTEAAVQGLIETLVWLYTVDEVRRSEELYDAFKQIVDDIDSQLRGLSK